MEILLYALTLPSTAENHETCVVSNREHVSWFGSVQIYKRHNSHHESWAQRNGGDNLCDIYAMYVYIFYIMISMLWTVPALGECQAGHLLGGPKFRKFILFM